MRRLLGNLAARITYARRAGSAEGARSVVALLYHRHVPLEGSCRQWGQYRYALCKYCGAKLPC